MSDFNPKRLPVSVSSAVFIEDRQGRLLLLQQKAKHKGSKWGPPASGMEAHEDPILATLRETKEEIGVAVKLTGLICIITVDRGNKHSGLGFIFQGEIDEKKIQPSPKEISDYRFFTKKEIKKLISKNLLYKPEFNLVSIQTWLNKNKKIYPITIIKPLIKNFSI